jgi:hypothetical protein
MNARIFAIASILTFAMSFCFSPLASSEEAAKPESAKRQEEKPRLPHRRLKGGFKGRSVASGDNASEKQAADTGSGSGASAPAGAPMVITNQMVRESEPPGRPARKTRAPAASRRSSAEAAPAEPDRPAKVPAPDSDSSSTPPAADGADGGFKDLQGHGKAYWQERARAARDRVAAARRDLDESEARVSRDENDFYSWDDGQYRDNVIKPEWDRAKEAVERAKRELQDATDALSSLEDEARKAGAFPGWIREP